MWKKYVDFEYDFSDDDDHDVDLQQLPEEGRSDWDDGLWEDDEETSPGTSQQSTPLGNITNRQVHQHQFICPECGKIYKSASGFREHAKKIHTQDLKASQHKHVVSVDVHDVVSGTNKAVCTKTTIQCGSQSVPVKEKTTSHGFTKLKHAYTVEELRQDMPSSTIQAFQDIINDNRLNFDGSVYGKSVCELAQLLVTCLQMDTDARISPITDLLVDIIWKVLESGDKMKSCSGQNEEVWHTFYNQWIDPSATNILSRQFRILLHDKTINDFHVFILIRLFLYRLLTLIRASCSKLNFSQKDVAIVMSVEEKQALRYFAGYVPFKILHKLKRSKRNMVGYISIVQNMREEKARYNGGSMAATKGWLHQQDRGGLFNLTDAAYLFFQEVECVCKTHLISDAFDSMSKDIHCVIEKDVFNNRNVNVLWSCVTHNVASEEDVSLALASMMIKLYVQIRCFSYAKSVIELVKKKKNMHTKGSKGLRKSLI